MYPPRPLHDEVDEQNVEEIVNALAGHDLTPDQKDYLDLLSDLLLKYQSDRHPRSAGRRTPGQRLKYLMPPNLPRRRRSRNRTSAERA